jgi:hypothetical protein
MAREREGVGRTCWALTPEFPTIWNWLIVPCLPGWPVPDAVELGAAGDETPAAEAVARYVVVASACGRGAAEARRALPRRAGTRGRREGMVVVRGRG